MPKVLFTIQYAVEPAKREAFMAHAREMREHARDVLGLDYEVLEDTDHKGSFTELFHCASPEDYDSLDERQDDRFRELVSRLDRFTDLAAVRYCAHSPVP